MADATNNSNTAQALRVTGNRDLVTASNLLKWTAQGKVWSVGVGVENAGIDGAAAIADITPTFALVAPTDPNVYVLPIMVRIGIHTEGGALQQIMVATTRAASDCATTLVISGTAFPAKQNALAGNTGAPQSAGVYTATASALTEADYIMHDLATTPDNPVSGTTGAYYNRGTTYELNMLEDPKILRSGAALLVWSVTGTTDTKNIPYITFAELTVDDFV